MLWQIFLYVKSRGVMLAIRYSQHHRNCRNAQTSLGMLMPQACNRSCGTYLLCLFLSTQSLSESEPSYCRGESPSVFTMASKELGPATTNGAAFPQLGLPRRLTVIVRSAPACRGERDIVRRRGTARCTCDNEWGL